MEIREYLDSILSAIRAVDAKVDAVDAKVDAVDARWMSTERALIP